MEGQCVANTEGWLPVGSGYAHLGSFGELDQGDVAVGVSEGSGLVHW